MKLPIMDDFKKKILENMNLLEIYKNEEKYYVQFLDYKKYDMNKIFKCINVFWTTCSKGKKLDVGMEAMSSLTDDTGLKYSEYIIVNMDYLYHSIL